MRGPPLPSCGVWRGRGRARTQTCGLRQLSKRLRDQEHRITSISGDCQKRVGEGVEQVRCLTLTTAVLAMGAPAVTRACRRQYSRRSSGSISLYRQHRTLPIMTVMMMMMMTRSPPTHPPTDKPQEANTTAGTPYPRPPPPPPKLAKRSTHMAPRMQVVKFPFSKRSGSDGDSGNSW
jgi:hypothetical protein